MSTRGCVAIKKEDGWKGVYNHHDSYPAGLGVAVYLHLKKLIKDEVAFKEFPSKLFYAGDWSNYLRGCKCPYCGKHPIGEAHSISGVIYGAIYPNIKTTVKEIKANIKKTGFPDPYCNHHQHDDLNDTMTDKTADAFAIEWVYVVDIENKKIEILTSHRIEGKLAKKYPKEDGSFYEIEVPKYSWSKVGEMDLSSYVTPDFEMLDYEGEHIANESFKKYED